MRAGIALAAIWQKAGKQINWKHEGNIKKIENINEDDRIKS